MRRIKAMLVVVAFSIVFSFMSTLPAFAAPCEPESDVLGIPTWYKYLEGEEIQGKCTPRVNAAEDALPIGLALLEALMTFAGVVAVVMVIWASFQFVLTQGEPDKAAAARKTAINAAIGLVIVIVATRVVSFIANTLTT